MPLAIVSLDPKENERATERAAHVPLRFTVWVTPNDARRVSHFATHPCPEKDLRRIADMPPTLNYMELVVLEDGGHAVGYLGHPHEYRPDFASGGARFRAKLVSGSNALMPQIQQALRPGTLEELAIALANEKRAIEREIAKLHERGEAIARAAHFVIPLLTPPNADYTVTSHETPEHSTGTVRPRRQYGDLDL